MKTTRERKEERRDGRNVVARRERERAYTPGVTKIGVDSRMDDGQTLGFYDLLTLVRVYRTRCDGHAAPSGENAATFASERILTHPTGSLSDRSISFLLPSSSFPSLDHCCDDPILIVPALLSATSLPLAFLHPKRADPKGISTNACNIFFERNTCEIDC